MKYKLSGYRTICILICLIYLQFRKCRNRKPHFNLHCQLYAVINVFDITDSKVRSLLHFHL